MKIRNSADWRDALPFELPVPAADAAPGEPARCAGCGADAEALPRERLWIVKHRHPNNPAGFVRLYCAEHRPKPAPAASAPAPSGRGASARSSRPAAPRAPRAPKAVVPERPVTMCPDCFVQVPATGICGMCGQRVA